jgi:hypothetical protein
MLPCPSVTGGCWRRSGLYSSFSLSPSSTLCRCSRCLLDPVAVCQAAATAPVDPIASVTSSYIAGVQVPRLAAPSSTSPLFPLTSSLLVNKHSGGAEEDVDLGRRVLGSLATSGRLRVQGLIADSCLGRTARQRATPLVGGGGRAVLSPDEDEDQASAHG